MGSQNGALDDVCTYSAVVCTLHVSVQPTSGPDATDTDTTSSLLSSSYLACLPKITGFLKKKGEATDNVYIFVIIMTHNGLVRLKLAS